MSDDAPLVYDLTPMTRKADEGRRFVVSGFDIQKRTMLVGGLAMIPAVAFIGAMFSVIHMWSLLAIPAFLGIAFWLVEGRSSQGMKLRNWQTLVDKRKGRTGQFFVCGHPIDVMDSRITVVRQLTAPVERTEVSEDDIFTIGGSK